LQTKAGAALPWLKLYAGTLLLGVVVPRLGLAWLALWRARGDLRRAIGDGGWPSYAMRMLRRVEGSDRPILVLAPGAVVDERVRRRWVNWLGMRFGGRSAFEIQAVPEGEQDEWVSAWEPRDGRVVVVFFLASTPEEEVQKLLVERLRERLAAAHYEAEVVVMLDANGLRERWLAGKRLGREKLWLQTLRGVADRVMVGEGQQCDDLREDLS
jgi:hypothetical protein